MTAHVLLVRDPVSGALALYFQFPNDAVYEHSKHPLVEGRLLMPVPYMCKGEADTLYANVRRFSISMMIAVLLMLIATEKLQSSCHVLVLLSCFKTACAHRV